MDDQKTQDTKEPMPRDESRPNEQTLARLAESQSLLLLSLGSLFGVVIVHYSLSRYSLVGVPIALAVISGLSWILLLTAVYGLAFHVTMSRAKAWLWTISMVLPLAWLVALVVLNGQTTKTLKSNGWTVGLLGSVEHDVGRQHHIAMLAAIWLIPFTFVGGLAILS